MAAELLRVRRTSSFLVCAAAAKLHPAKKRAGDLLPLVGFKDAACTRKSFYSIMCKFGSASSRKSHQTHIGARALRKLEPQIRQTVYQTDGWSIGRPSFRQKYCS